MTKSGGHLIAKIILTGFEQKVIPSCFDNGNSYIDKMFSHGNGHVSGRSQIGGGL